MARVIKVDLNGQQVDAIELEFDIGREEWNVYELADGGRVRVKTIVQKIMRVIDNQGNPAYSPDGDPFIIVKSINQVVSTE